MYRACPSSSIWPTISGAASTARSGCCRPPKAGCEPVRRRLVLAGLLLIVAGCAPALQRDLAGVVRPAEIAYLMCRQHRPGDDSGCQGVHLPDPTSALAYGTCLEYHRLDVKACNDL